MKQQNATKTASSIPKTAIVIGGGVIGVSTAFQLARRGLSVTILEKNEEIAGGASHCNGAILCQSMAATWACTSLFSKYFSSKVVLGLTLILGQNPSAFFSSGLKIGLSAFTDPNFYRWGAWYWFNCLMPGRADYNHESCRQLAYLRLVQPVHHALSPYHL